MNTKDALYHGRKGIKSVALAVTRSVAFGTCHPDIAYTGNTWTLEFDQRGALARALRKQHHDACTSPDERDAHAMKIAMTIYGSARAKVAQDVRHEELMGIA